jgi:hypothetical protein
MRTNPLIHRSSLWFQAAALDCAFLLAASAASAESRIFIIANLADGRGVVECLAKGEKCGQDAARSYCQSRDFAHASSYRRADADEITGSVPGTSGAACNRGLRRNTLPLPVNAKALRRGDLEGRLATPAPRNRRDAAPGSGYVKRR